MHFILYIKLLDALADGMENDEMCTGILQIDPTTSRMEAHDILASHIKRAQWMSKAGFRNI
jgi:hypothetical protein